MPPDGLVTPFTRLHRYPANTYDLLKSVAVLAMVLDHIGLYLLPEQGWWRVVGRAAFPLFLFLVGYSGKATPARRLLASALAVSGMEYLYSGSVLPFNILWAIVLTRWYLGRFSPEAAQSHLVVLMVGWVVAVPVMTYGTAPLVFGITGRMARRATGKPSPRFIILVLLVLAAHTVSQLVSFKFDTGQTVATIAMGLGLGMTLSRFHLRPMGLPFPLVWLSRYALEVYVIHLGILMSIALLR